MMDLETRYMLANARLSALGEPRNWTAQDLADVFALVPGAAMSLPEWAGRVGGVPPVTPAPAPTAEEEADHVTTQTMNMLFGPKGQDLIKSGIVEIKEVHE